MKKVVIQGLGFVGSATAVAISSKLNKNNKPLFDVTGIDLNNRIGKIRVNQINSGNFPFKTLDHSISKEAKKSFIRGNLNASFSSDVYSNADIIIISINYDLERKNKKKLNLSDFKKSCSVIAKKISKNTLIIVQSTVAPGTCEKIIYPILNKNLIKRKINPKLVWLAHSYERVMPGKNYLQSITNYWRVYSGINDISAKKCADFLKKIINTKKYPLTKLDSTTSSEIAKVLENSYRAVNIAFIEEWSRFCEEINIDLFEIISAIKKRPTHSNLMKPGFGVGGYCLTKDPLFAKVSANQIFNINDHKFFYSTNAVKINNQMPNVSLNKLISYFKNDLKNKSILLMGASYREEIADTRYSPSEIFYKNAVKKGINVDVHDPMVSYWDELSLKICNRIPDIKKYNAIVFAVQHMQYKKINFNNLIKNNSKILVFDANNVLSSSQIKTIKSKRNISFISIGR